jgi:hypothetical protein
MRFLPSFVVVVILPLAFAAPVSGDVAPPGRRIMFFEYGLAPNRFVELDKDGKITREFKPPSIAVIFQVLPDGNVLYAYGGKPTGVREVDRSGKTVWEYISQCPQVLSCERLANGNTLVGEQQPCQAVEVDPKGKVVHVTPLKSADPHFHRQLRGIHELPSGNVLAAHEFDGAVREYTPEGKVVWEFTDAENTCDAIRLENGNTLVACGTKKRVVEVTPDGKVVWSFGASDAPELNLTTIYSLQVLKNGNYLIGNFLRDAKDPSKGVHAFEVTRDKKVVWTFADHERFKSIMTIRAPDEMR